MLSLINPLLGAAGSFWSGDECPEFEVELGPEVALGLGDGVAIAAAGVAAEEDELDDAAAVFEPEGCPWFEGPAAEGHAA